jgi:hypothetical protein
MEILHTRRNRHTTAGHITPYPTRHPQIPNASKLPACGCTLKKCRNMSKNRINLLLFYHFSGFVQVFLHTRVKKEGRIFVLAQKFYLFFYPHKHEEVAICEAN